MTSGIGTLSHGAPQVQSTSTMPYSLLILCWNEKQNYVFLTGELNVLGNPLRKDEVAVMQCQQDKWIYDSIHVLDTKTAVRET